MPGSSDPKKSFQSNSLLHECINKRLEHAGVTTLQGTQQNRPYFRNKLPLSWPRKAGAVQQTHTSDTIQQE